MAKETTSPLLPLVRSKLKVRGAIKGLEIAAIEKLIANLNDVLKSEKDKEHARAASEKKSKIEKIKALMAESGLQADDLKAAPGKKRGRKPGRPAAAKKAGAGRVAKTAKTPKAKVAKKTKAGKAAKGAKAKAAPKYRLVVDGTEHLWSGRGRPPRVFKDHMDAGNSKESCAI